LEVHPSRMIQDFLSHMETNGYSPNTIRAYRADLTKVLPSLPLPMSRLYGDPSQKQELEVMPPLRQEIERCLAIHLRDGLRDEGWSVNTHNRKLATFRAFGKFCGWTDFLASYKRPPSPPGIPHPLPEGVPGILLMLEACRKKTHRALVALCGLCGCRVGEALKVRPSDIEVQADRVLLTVHGKGNKTRVVPLSDRACMEIMPRLAVCMATDERLVPLTDRPARAAFNSIGRRALGRDDVASHDMRMTAGTSFYAKTKNIRVVQELLGHSSSQTTENYTYVSLDDMGDAVEIS
jgi:integrase